MVPKHNEGKYGDQRRSIFSPSSPTHPPYNKEDKDTPLCCHYGGLTGIYTHNSLP